MCNSPSGDIEFVVVSFFAEDFCFLLKQAKTEPISDATIIQKKTTKSRPDVFVNVTHTVGRVLLPSVDSFYKNKVQNLYRSK